MRGIEGHWADEKARSLRKIAVIFGESTSVWGLGPHFKELFVLGHKLDCSLPACETGFNHLAATVRGAQSRTFESSSVRMIAIGA